MVVVVRFGHLEGGICIFSQVSLRAFAESSESTESSGETTKTIEALDAVGILGERIKHVSSLRMLR